MTAPLASRGSVLEEAEKKQLKPVPSYGLCKAYLKYKNPLGALVIKILSLRQKNLTALIIGFRYKIEFQSPKLQYTGKWAHINLFILTVFDNKYFVSILFALLLLK